MKGVAVISGGNLSSVRGYLQHVLSSCCLSACLNQFCFVQHLCGCCSDDDLHQQLRPRSAAVSGALSGNGRTC